MKQAIVVNKDNIKVEFVLVDEKNEPLYYTLKKDEKLIFDKIGDSFNLIKAKWTGIDWVESATAEEIEKARPKPLPLPPNTDLILAKSFADMRLENIKLQSMVQAMTIAQAQTRLELIQLKKEHATTV